MDDSKEERRKEGRKKSEAKHYETKKVHETYLRFAGFSWCRRKKRQREGKTKQVNYLQVKCSREYLSPAGDD